MLQGRVGTELKGDGWIFIGFCLWLGRVLDVFGENNIKAPNSEKSMFFAGTEL
jgi:hypothetical protein